MTKPITSIMVLAALLAVAACGSSGPHSATSAPGAQMSTKTKTSTNPTSTQTRRLTTHARQVLRQIAAQTGNLATGKSSIEQHVRGRLAQLQRDARALESTAVKQLPPGSPARTLIAEASQRAASVAGKLRYAQPNAATRTALHNAQSTLRSLSAAIGQVASAS